mmetsp:Transcript_136552/g.291648  ORF Transcript_136552/g.291648 Transcript_136552/m.291648 type:complete len:334 (+) Transcript_136552:1377-2378(+)
MNAFSLLRPGLLLILQPTLELGDAATELTDHPRSLILLLHLLALDMLHTTSELSTVLLMSLQLRAKALDCRACELTHGLIAVFHLPQKALFPQGSLPCDHLLQLDTSLFPADALLLEARLLVEELLCEAALALLAHGPLLVDHALRILDAATQLIHGALTLGGFEGESPADVLQGGLGERVLGLACLVLDAESFGSGPKALRHLVLALVRDGAQLIHGTAHIHKLLFEAHQPFLPGLTLSTEESPKLLRGRHDALLQALRCAGEDLLACERLVLDEMAQLLKGSVPLRGLGVQVSAQGLHKSTALPIMLHLPTVALSKPLQHLAELILEAGNR